MVEPVFQTEEKILEHKRTKFKAFIDRPQQRVEKGAGVVMVHGGLDDENQPAQKRIAEELGRRGFTVMRVRLPFINKHEPRRKGEPTDLLEPYKKMENAMERLASRVVAKLAPRGRAA